MTQPNEADKPPRIEGAATYAHIPGTHHAGLVDGDLTSVIIDAFHTVHRELGRGLVEAVYVRALAIELFQRKVSNVREVPVTVYYKGVTVGTFRADLLVEDRVVVDVTVPANDRDDVEVTEPAKSVLVNYLKASGKEIGLVLHFGRKPVIRRAIYTKDADRRGERCDSVPVGANETELMPVIQPAPLDPLAPTGLNVTCPECEAAPREIVQHTDDAGVSWGSLWSALVHASRQSEHIRDNRHPLPSKCERRRVGPVRCGSGK